VRVGADAPKIIDYRTQSVVEEALVSKYAPYAVVLDCVGGTDFIPYLDHLIMHDPEAPHLGVYLTIVGDSEFTSFRASVLVKVT
jgi:NADPH:quinone reductase-like Zn-dependent oxidoreductase